MNHPTGKGMFIWQVKRVYFGKPDVIAHEAKRLGLSWVIVKVMNNKWSYNLHQDPITKEWTDSILPPLVDVLHRDNIKVYGYQYIYLDEPEDEAYSAVRRVGELGLDGFVIDAERECYEKAKEAVTYADIIKEKLTMPVGLCSFRFPSLHEIFPFAQLLQCCTFHLPQVYWAKSVNPTDQLRRSYQELTKKRNLPFIPVGAAYNEHGWSPTIEEINEFDQVAREELKLPGICWWEWYEAIENGYEKTIADHPWGSSPILLENQPEEGVELSLFLTDSLKIEPGVDYHVLAKVRSQGNTLILVSGKEYKFKLSE